MNTATISMSLHLTPETLNILEEICEDNNLTKTDLLRKALALIQIALKYKKKGGHLIVVDDKDHKMSEIIGL